MEYDDVKDEEWGLLWHSPWRRVDDRVCTLLRWQEMRETRGLPPDPELDTRIDRYRAIQDRIARTIINNARRAK